MGNAAALNADRLALLGAGRDLDLLRTVNGGNLDHVTECGLRDAQGQFVEDIGAVSLQHGVRFDVDDNVEVTGRPTTGTDFALAREPDLGAAVDPSRNVDPHLLLTRLVAGSAAGPAGSVDHLPLSVAAWAARYVDDLSEDRLGGTPHLAAPPALWARLRRGARLGARAPAGLARLRSRDGELALDAKDGLLEGQSQVEPKIRPPPGSGARAARGGRAKEHVEDVVDAAEAGPAEVETRHALSTGMAEGVVALPLRLVAQDLVGFVDLLEAGFRLRIAVVAVRVILESEFSIGTLQFLGTGI